MAAIPCGSAGMKNDAALAQSSLHRHARMLPLSATMHLWNAMQ
jgi:hypothetical protein